MLILLPPSEGKKVAATKKKLNLNSLSFAEELTPARKEALKNHPDIDTSLTSPAIYVYSGVLYQALDFGTLSASAKKKAGGALLIISAIYGALRPEDEISTYKAKIIPSLWKEPLTAAFAKENSSLVIDMRSSTYSAAWTPEPSKTVSVRIFTMVNGEQKVITHMSKKYRGEITRLLLLEKTSPKSPQELATLISRAYPCTLVEPEGKKSWYLDVIV